MSEKKKFTLRLVCSLLAVVLPALILFVTVFALPTQYDLTFFGELNEKHDRLKSTEGRRIIVVGGSSVAFGLDSQLLEIAMPGYSVVNFGLYAELGTKIMLDLSRDDIREGDIVVLAPEMDSQTLSLYFNGLSALKAADDDKSLIFECDTDDMGSLWGAAWDFIVSKIGYIFGDKPDPEGVYNSANFNKYGDIDPELFPRTENIMAGGYDKNQVITLDGSIFAPDFIDYVNKYIADAEKKGATVYYSFCPINKESVDLSGKPEGVTDYEYMETLSDGLVQFLSERIDCDIIGTPIEHLFESELFYDTNFHLNDMGVPRHTALLADHIRGAQQSNAVDSVKADGRYYFTDSEFVYRSTSATTCEIIGTTAAAKRLTVLIVPAQAHGMNVTAIAPGALSDTIVESFVIPSVNNLTVPLSAGLFEGVHSAVKISVAMYQTPSAALFGGDLGQDVNIKVPRDIKADYEAAATAAGVAYRVMNSFTTTEAYIEMLAEEHAELEAAVAAREEGEHFIFEKDADTSTWTIVGLTEAGKNATALMIPTTFQGAEDAEPLRVSMLREYALSEAVSLTSIILPSDITPFTLANFAFYDSPVKKVYIYSDFTGFNVPTREIFSGTVSDFGLYFYGNEILNGFSTGYGWIDMDQSMYRLNTVPESEILAAAETEKPNESSPLISTLLITMIIVLAGIGVWLAIRAFDLYRAKKKAATVSDTDTDPEQDDQ